MHQDGARRNAFQLQDAQPERDEPADAGVLDDEPRRISVLGPEQASTLVAESGCGLCLDPTPVEMSGRVPTTARCLKEALVERTEGLRFPVPLPIAGIVVHQRLRWVCTEPDKQTGHGRGSASVHAENEERLSTHDAMSRDRGWRRLNPASRPIPQRRMWCPNVSAMIRR
jgi:hypothetical protein